MIQLVSKDLSEAANRQLEALQRIVNDEPTFAARAAKAKLLWTTKGGVAGKSAFSEVLATLESMAVSVELCNYCEHNEGNDIEHIYPKSFFPENAFVWGNYLLACKQCNTGFKLDKCYVITDDDEIVEVNRGVEPLSKSVAFINPRNEDPNKFMLLNLGSFKFEILPDIGVRNEIKAQKTQEILELNTRDTLLESRKNAAIYYYSRLEMLSRVLGVDTVLEIRQILSPYDAKFENNLVLDKLKQNIKEGFRRDIQTHSHPSVWHAVKTIESKVNPQWQALFAKIPEALFW